MPDSFDIDYDSALEHLCAALIETWNACEATGANLPEALSFALALSGRELAHAACLVDPSDSGDNEVDHELAVGVLVRQRPGSWEASHVAGLTYPVDLLPPAHDRPTG
jgi:hypothetical protein